MDQNSGAHHHQTVLIVDDDPAILELISKTLTDSYKVLSASSGQQAMAQSRSYDGRIHLLVSDFEMPDMNGIELATAISAERPDIKVLLMSGCDPDLLRLKVGWRFLGKPFRPSQFHTLVSSLISPRGT